MKWISLVSLVLQTVGVVFAIRLSRTNGKGSNYLNTTAVFLTEVVKCIISILFLLNEKGVGGAATAMQLHLLDVRSWLRTSAPCLLYTLQNNLIFIALSNLPAAEYQ